MGQVLSGSLPGHRKLVLLALADHANDGGLCWPGQATVAQKASLSVRRCREHLARLERDGWVRRTGGVGRGVVTHYALNVAMIAAAAQKADALSPFMEKEDAPSPFTPPEKRTFATQKGDVGAEKRTFATQKADTSEPPNRHEPSVEPSLNRDRARATRWEPPDWWEPLAVLSGYRVRNYQRHADGVAKACAAEGVEVAGVVREFVSRWPTLKVRYGWTDPVATFKGRVLGIAISQARDGHGPGEGGHYAEFGPGAQRGARADPFVTRAVAQTEERLRRERGHG